MQNVGTKSAFAPNNNKMSYTVHKTLTFVFRRGDW